VAHRYHWHLGNANMASIFSVYFREGRPPCRPIFSSCIWSQMISRTAPPKKNETSAKMPGLVRGSSSVRKTLLNVCLFCMDIGRSFAIKATMNEAKFDALEQYLTSPLFTDAERSALAYATELTKEKKLVRTPLLVCPAIFPNARSARSSGSLPASIYTT